eukprot:TRINITY_DN1185_c0_g1_i7.p1 TRINITY_DN1185_c0_g1~~TRINITY_DN1185_c0_g1_i7.p1  ORF type:complete len:537 (+),score=115.99 TRINITY_DN1185_c0_g1_i7:66-1676(+)
MITRMNAFKLSILALAVFSAQQYISKIGKDLAAPHQQVRLASRPTNIIDTTERYQERPSNLSSPEHRILGGRIKIKRTGPWNIGTCTGTKGSGEWLREWIELQLLGGVDHIWVVDENDPDTADATPGILKYYEELGYVTIIPGKMPKKWPGCEQLAGENARNPNAEHNCIPPKYCMHHAGRHVKWLVFADTDEFMFPLNGCSLSDHVEANCDPYESHQLLRWERFGTSGHNVHPSGLMIENFLSSGGDCSHLEWCKENPYSICPPCRHNKVMYNTQCLGEEHAGWIHWPTNTSEWKREMHSNKLLGAHGRRRWVASPGRDSNMLDERCVLNKARKEKDSCTMWLQDGGGAVRPVEYNKECCSAGIGYNHYGSKSVQYHARKSVSAGESKRGLRLQLESIDLNMVLSTGILKFLKALRDRYLEMRLPVSQNIAFVESAKGTCFIEHNYKYSLTEESFAVTTTDIKTSQSGCCESCLQEECHAFTYSVESGICTLFHPDVIPGTRRKPLPHHIKASREWTKMFVSGTPIREQCHVPGR